MGKRLLYVSWFDFASDTSITPSQNYKCARVPFPTLSISDGHIDYSVHIETPDVVYS
ncbi:MAG: hypothetical protein QM784_23515 [Polyangiaceae bacterium]